MRCALTPRDIQRRSNPRGAFQNVVRHEGTPSRKASALFQQMERSRVGQEMPSSKRNCAFPCVCCSHSTWAFAKNIREPVIAAAFAMHVEATRARSRHRHRVRSTSRSKRSASSRRAASPMRSTSVRKTRESSIDTRCSQLQAVRTSLRMRLPRHKSFCITLVVFAGVCFG